MVFVRAFLGLGQDEVPSLAKNLKTNSLTPEVGAVIKLNESPLGHVAVVLSFTNTEVTIGESNVPMGSERIGIRTLKINDPRILGYLIGGG